MARSDFAENEIREKQIMAAVSLDGSEPRHYIWIECPYPLIAAGLARALEGTSFRYMQGPVETKVPHLVVLWADDAGSLSESVEHLRKARPNLVILVLGLCEDLGLAAAALKAGARGFIHAGLSAEQTARALSMAARGKVVAPRELIGYLIDEISVEESAELQILSRRQREILELVAEGLSNREIAERLFVTESTVKQHLRAAYKLLGVSNRAEATELVRLAKGGNASKRRSPGRMGGNSASALFAVPESETENLKRKAPEG